jgi:hypothetical protein
MSVAVSIPLQVLGFMSLPRARKTGKRETEKEPKKEELTLSLSYLSPVSISRFLIACVVCFWKIIPRSSRRKRNHPYEADGRE